MSTTRVIHKSRPGEAEYIERIAALVEAEKPDLIRRFRLADAAAEEPGFCGELRRAIHSGDRQLDSLAAIGQIHVFTLCDFLEGTAELTSEQIRRIANELGLQLVRSIPSAKLNAK